MSEKYNSVTDYFAHFENDWEKEPPASEESLRELKALQDQIPADYVEFLRYSDGSSGQIPIEPGYFQLWSCRELRLNNERFNSKEFGLFIFGTSGGGDCFAFNTEIPSYPIYLTDAGSIGDPVSTKQICEDFLSFLALFGKGEWNFESDDAFMSY